jgi:alanine dehydrogenase
MVASMQAGSVIVDVAVDQGGCIETTRETSHSAPTYTKHGVIHYAVGNMPGAVPHTSTHALTNVTLPYITELALNGHERTLLSKSALRTGLNTLGGEIMKAEIADALNLSNSHTDRIA